MEVNFKQALAWVRVSETGHTDSDTSNEAHWGNGDDPDDSGGRTSRGITQRECDAYCRMAGLPHGDVYKAPNPVIDDIYHRSYWVPYCPIMPAGVDYMLFDDSVLSGPVTAIMSLQRALGVAADGHIGVLTSEALSKADHKQLVEAIANARLDRYHRIEQARPKDLKFARGWENRVAFAVKNAHTLLAASTS
jgi:lysozyme family protein